MKRVNVAKLKAELSRYMRLVQQGEQVLVLRRKHVIAKIVAVGSEESPWERLAREGRCRLGTQHWEDFEAPRLRKRVPIDLIMREVGGDSLGTSGRARES